jgi:FlaG/FlaF family flagellin (archaellin)
MKNFSKIIGVTLLVALVVIIGAFTYHSMYGNPEAKSKRSMYTVPGLKEVKGKPTTGYSGSYGSTVSTPVAMPEQELSDDNLMDELQKTVDDGGQADLEALKQQSAGL